MNKSDSTHKPVERRASVPVEEPAFRITPDEPKAAPKATKPKLPPAPKVAGTPLKVFPIGKIFNYEGQTWRKAGILPTVIRCQLCEEKDGGLFVNPSVTRDFAPETEVS
jgi:hypothetical protein